MNQEHIAVKRWLQAGITYGFVFLFVCFVALRPKSTAMVMAGPLVHLTIFFLGKLEQAVNQYFVHILSLVTDNNPSWMIQVKVKHNFAQFPLHYVIYAPAKIAVASVNGLGGKAFTRNVMDIRSTHAQTDDGPAY